jgi:hypothetical protein
MNPFPLASLNLYCSAGKVENYACDRSCCLKQQAQHHSRRPAVGRDDRTGGRAHREPLRKDWQKLTGSDFVPWIHVPAACIWIGGQITLGMMMPMLRTVPDVMRDIARRFQNLAWGAFAILIGDRLDQFT